MGYSSITDIRLLTRTIYPEKFTGQATVAPTFYTAHEFALTGTLNIYSAYLGGTALTATSSSSPSASQYKATIPNKIKVGATLATSSVLKVKYYLDVVPDAEITDCISEADGYINNRLNPFYTTPFTVDSAGKYPPDIVRASKYLASAYIIERIYIGEQPNITNIKTSEYERKATKIIEDLQFNRVALCNSLGAVITRKDAITSTTDSEEPIFSMGADDTWGDDFEENTFEEM